jgi:hypothetical protein
MGRVYEGGASGTLAASSVFLLDRGSILSDPTPDPVPAELAPFLAQARTGLEAATDGLQTQEAIEHLETTMARAEIEASKLGIRFDRALDGEALGLPEQVGPVVVIRRLVEGDE